MTTSIEEVYNFRRSRLDRAYEQIATKDFKKKLQNYIEKPVNLEIDGFEFHYQSTINVGIQKQNSLALRHTTTCSEYSDPLDLNIYKFEADQRFYAVAKSAADLVLRNSKLCIDLIEKHGGMWFRALEAQFKSSVDKPYSRGPFLEYSLLELLLPGFQSWLEEEFEKGLPKTFQINNEYSQSLFGGSRIREKRVPQSRYFTTHKIVEYTIDFIGDHRGKCRHLQNIVCQVCGASRQPNLYASVEWRFPTDICHRCVSISDYHPNALLQEGLDPQVAMDAQIEAVKFLNESTEIPLWSLLPADKYLYFALNLESRPQEELPSFLKVLAALNSGVEWESKYHLLSAAGLEQLIPRGKGRGIKSISSCQHLCLSEGERAICETLHQRRISHTREPIYADLIVDDQGLFGMMRGDFLVGDLVLEFAGLTGDETYDTKMQLKRDLCEKFGIRLEVIEPSDLSDLALKLDQFGLKAKVLES